ncbi:MAG TPA: AAA family ATPase [Dehalococcoidia bacterium]|nr:AAA family ATPase [Dehalococcoidia bacterium]
MNLHTSALATTYIGRERELALLGTLLDAVVEGGSVALVYGEAGIGKTRTAEELARAAAARGLRVLWGRCHESEGAPPFWPWVQVIRGCLREAEPERLRAELGTAAPIVAQLVPELHDLIGAQPEPPPIAPDQAQFQMFDGLARFLFAAARRQPLLIVLDDLHWADSASLLQLQFMVRELRDAPLVILATYRDDEATRGRPLARALADLARSPILLRLPLAGLTKPDIARLVATVTGKQPPEPLVDLVTRETEGNPFFASEILRLLSADGRLDAWGGTPTGAIRWTIPHTVRDAIGRRLELLSDACIATLATASVLGQEFQLRPLQAVVAVLPDARLSAEDVLDALEEAETRGIIEAVPASAGWYRFAHALIRNILYEDLPSTRRMRLHRLAGEALERLYGGGAGAQLAELASHFVRAAPARDAGKAARYERWAGDHALTIYAYEEAAEHFASALHVLDLAGNDVEELAEESTPSARCDLLLSLGNARRMAGDVAIARETFLRAAALAQRDKARFVRAVQGIAADIPQRHSGDPELARLLGEALAMLEQGDSRERAMLLIRLAIELWHLPEVERSLELGTAGAAMARRLADAEATAYALRFEVLSGALDPERRLARSEELVQLARAEQNLALELSGHGWCAICLLELGDAAGAEAAIEAYAALAERLRQPVHLAQVAALRSTTACMSGRFSEAEAAAEAGFALAQRAGRADARTTHAGLLLILRILQGRLEGLQEVLQGFAAEYPSMAVWRCGLAYLYAELELEAEARVTLEAVAADGFETIPQDNLWLTSLTSLAECCAFLADAERAIQLYDLLLPYARCNVVISGGAGCTGSVARCLGLLATTLQRWEDAERHFEAALAMNARLGALPWLAVAQCNYAAMLLARGAPGDRERAAALLAQAAATAVKLDMASLTRRCEALSAVLQAAAPAAAAAGRGRAEYPDGLSEREAEVLKLLAAGLSNKEIADRLVLSPRTVETHIQRTYAKIGVRGRSEAVAYAIRHGLV